MNNDILSSHDHLKKSSKSGDDPTSKDDVAPYVHWAGRIGYAAKGTVYAIIGVLACLQLFGSGGKSTGSTGALVAIDQQPFGNIVLYVVAGGLVLYTLWRFAQGFLDVENKGSDYSDLVKRAGLIISGGIYAVLAWQAMKLAMDASRSSTGQKTQTAQEALSQPGGSWLVLAVGAGFLCVGLYQLWRAYSLDFKKHWKADLDGKLRRRLTHISRFGVAARAVIFVLIGGYIINAGLESDASEVKGLGGVLKTFATDPWLLGAFSVGIICYATYAWTNAIYRRIPAS